MQIYSQFCAILQLCNAPIKKQDRSPVSLSESVPVGISGFVDAAKFAPTAEERVDAGRRDRLVLARSQTDEVSGGEVLGEE